MVDGLDFEKPDKVRLHGSMEATLTRGFNGSPKYQHRPGERWEWVNSPAQANDDLGPDRERLEMWFYVGDLWMDTVNNPPEVVQITSLTYVTI